MTVKELYIHECLEAHAYYMGMNYDVDRDFSMTYHVIASAYIDRATTIGEVY